MKAAPFEYHAPASVTETLELLDRYAEDDVKVLAGGQSLIPMMALRLARFDHLVDLNRVPSLRYIREQDGMLRIGAMTTQACIAGQPEHRPGRTADHPRDDAHRALPDPQPWDYRRFTSARRRRSRVPGSGADPGRHVRDHGQQRSPAGARC